MAYVITEKCLGERYATCVEVCPVDCIHPGEYQGEEFMVIDPDACIDCSLCKPECPIDAIVAEDDLPEDQSEYLQLNADLSAEWPVITEKKDAPPDAAEWENKPDKLRYLER